MEDKMTCAYTFTTSDEESDDDDILESCSEQFEPSQVPGGMRRPGRPGGTRRSGPPSRLYDAASAALIEDPERLSVPQLEEALTKLRVRSNHCVEKSELVALYRLHVSWNVLKMEPYPQGYT